MAMLDITLPRRAAAHTTLFDLARTFGALRRQRAALSRLDDARLQDLGLTRAEALSEANRPIWDVPNTWRR